MADTGIDPSVCFIEDPDTPVPYNKVTGSHRKLTTYVTFADRQENTEKQGGVSTIGHGTHVASTLAGRSTISRASAEYNGMAPNSKVRRGGQLALWSSLCACISMQVYPCARWKWGGCCQIRGCLCSFLGREEGMDMQKFGVEGESCGGKV